MQHWSMGAKYQSFQFCAVEFAGAGFRLVARF
jgi:hypothetical protein